jgi:ABC-2 type transport system ATP-binding protein
MDDIINLEHVYKKLGNREILKDVTFVVKRGDIFGYLGPNGAGKTTSIRIIMGLFAPTSGKVSVLGQDTQSDNVRKKIGFVLEADGLYENMAAYDNLVYYARLYDVTRPDEKVNRAIGLVGLADRAKDKVGTYSKGMRQRLALARAMLSDPEVLVLDEPTAGVDPSGQIEIRRVMLDMVHKEGKTILLSSHNLDEVQRICNRIALIDKGQVRLYGELEKLQHEMSHGEVVIETAEPLTPEMIANLKTFPEINVLEQRDKILTLSAGKNMDVSNIVTFLASRGVRIEQVKKQEATLEEIYTTIVKEAEQK